MATIATTTNATPFQYPGMSLLARHPYSNTYVCLVKGSTADNYLFYKSTDGGGTWVLLATVVRANLVDVGQIFVDRYNWMFWAFRTNESSQDRVYMRRMDLANGNMVPSGETLFASAGNGAVAGAVYSGLDIKTVYLPSNGFHYIAVVAGTNIGGNQGATLFAGLIDPVGNGSSANQYISGTRQWLHAGTAGRVGPSMDIEHNGSGYDGTPNLWIAYGRTHLRLVKVSWTGSGWSGSPGESRIYDNVGSPNQMAGRWDGSRFLMAVPDPVNTSQVMVLERDRANSTTVIHRTPVHTTGVVRNATASYDPNTGNVRVWAVGTSTAVLYQADWTRGSDTWSGWGSTAATILGANADNYGAKRSSYGDARWGLYTAASGAPNTLTYTPIALAYAPNTPTWLNPASGAAADVGESLTLTWVFSDLDPGDAQSAYAVSKQIGAGALSYWRASDSTWQVAEVKNTSGTSSITVPTAWAAHTDAMHTFKAKVWDAADLASGYSAGLMVLPSTPVNPAITAPTPSQVIGFSSMALTWTASEQTQYRTTMDSGGVLDTFTRTTASSWGSTDSGQAWTNTNGTAADFSTTGSVGQHSNATVAILRSSTIDVGSSDQDITVDVAVNVASASGASISQWVCARLADLSNYYVVQPILTTSGAVTLQLFKRTAGTLSGGLVPAVTVATSHASGDVWRVRLQVIGSTIQAKAWPAAAAEPPLWTMSTTDTSLTTGTQIGLLSRMETGNTNTLPITTTFDNLLVVPGGAVDYDSGWTGDAAARSVTPPVVLTDTSKWVATLLTRNVEGLESVKQRVYFSVSFTPPATPTYTVTPIASAGVIRVVITNPTPTGGQPAVATQDLYRRAVGNTTTGVRAATGLVNAATYDDWRAVGSINYEYRVLTIGTTGVSTFGAWTA